MTIGFFIRNVLVILLACGMICFLKWLLDNAEFSENPKIQRVAEIVVKVVIGLFASMLTCLVIQVALILLAPLFEQLNLAFNAAVAKIFAFLDNIIPYAVLGGIAMYWWKNRQPQSDTGDSGEDNLVDVEYAEQEAAELHDDLGELVFNAVVDISENTPLKRPRDTDSIETGREIPYTIDGIMVVHQFSVDTDTPLDKDSENLTIRELQRHMNQRGKCYPQLRRDGRAPIICDIKDNGNFVIVEVVLYSDKYKDKIEARRKARISHKQKMGDTNDKDF